MASIQIYPVLANDFAFDGMHKIHHLSPSGRYLTLHYYHRNPPERLYSGRGSAKVQIRDELAIVILDTLRRSVKSYRFIGAFGEGSYINQIIFVDDSSLIISYWAYPVTHYLAICTIDHVNATIEIANQLENLSTAHIAAACNDLQRKDALLLLNLTDRSIARVDRLDGADIVVEQKPLTPPLSAYALSRLRRAYVYSHRSICNIYTADSDLIEIDMANALVTSKHIKEADAPTAAGRPTGATSADGHLYFIDTCANIWKLQSDQTVWALHGTCGAIGLHITGLFVDMHGIAYVVGESNDRKNTTVFRVCINGHIPSLQRMTLDFLLQKCTFAQLHSLLPRSVLHGIA